MKEVNREDMISVIIPTHNNENVIGSTIAHLKKNACCRLLKEIIVIDAGSTDQTAREAQQAGATVLKTNKKTRASQFNLGAEHATGKILYFLLPGSLPPKHYANEIVRATQKGFSCGSFTITFEYRPWALKILSWLTRQKINLPSLDDQSLFVLQELFEKAGKFREDLMIAEDRELILRMKRYAGFVILKDSIGALAKKYFHHGILRTELSNIAVGLLYRLGCSQERIVRISGSILKQRESGTALREQLSASLSS